jgi:hypothetical protein
MWHRRAFLGIIGAVFVAGCRSKFKPTPPKVYLVKGNVLLADGTPVSGGIITFHPKTTSGSVAWGEIGPDGSFQLTTIAWHDGALPGSYTVSVNPFVNDGQPSFEPVSPVPPKFTAAETSGLTVEIEAKDTELKIELK